MFINKIKVIFQKKLEGIKIKLKRIEDNHDYIIDVNNSDNIYAVKNKLSRITKLNCDGIILIHKNRILKNDKLIIDYNIDKNDFVLFSDGEMDYCYNNDGNRFKEKYCAKSEKKVTKRNCSKCWRRILIKQETIDKSNQLNDDDEKINVFIEKSNNFLCFVANRNERIYDAVNAKCIDYINKYKFGNIALLHNGEEFDKNKTTADYDDIQLNDGIHLVLKVKNQDESGWVQCLKENINRCRDCRNFELLHSGKYLDVNKTFAHYKNEDGSYEIWDGSTIRLVSIIKGGGIGISIKSIIDHFDSCRISPESYEKSVIINKISKEIKIPQKNIKLFLDKNQSKPIKSDIDLPKYDDNLQIDIYFTIKPNFENFVKLEKLGKGSFGTVFKCISIETKKEMAVKRLEIPSKGKSKENERLSIEREIQVYCKPLDHPRVVKYERNFQTENAVFLVMEYMKGGSLHDYLEGKPLSEEKIKKYSKQILEALQYLHEQKILHRDIKSDNILLDEDDNVKLCDFGLSKILTDLATKDFLNGAIQTLIGTVNYMAPEIMNEEPSGSSADVWSFGATIVEMVTGFRPYHKMGACKVMKIISESRKIEYNFPNDLSDNLKSFIDSCLQPDPSRRLTSEQLMSHPFLQTY